MMEHGIKVAPIWSPVEPREIRPIIEARNAFAPEPIPLGPMIVCLYHGLPRAVLSFLETKYNKKGRDLVKKVGQLLTVSTMKGVFTDKITPKMGFQEVYRDVLWSCLKKVGGNPVMAFNFGLVFLGSDSDQAEQRMADGVEWLGFPVGIEIKEME
jgi:hypothetical protein